MQDEQTMKSILNIQTKLLQIEGKIDNIYLLLSEIIKQTNEDH